MYVIEVRVGRIRTQLLDDLRNIRYWELKEVVQDKKDEKDSLSIKHKEEIQVIFQVN